MQNNFITTIKKIQQVLRLRNSRTLPLEGRIMMFKTLAISKIVYIALITNVPKEMLKNFKKYIQLTYIVLKVATHIWSPDAKALLEIIPIIQLYIIENKTVIDISDQKLKEVLGKSKIEQQLLNKMEGQEVTKESDDNNNAKVFDFSNESQKREVKLEKDGCKKRETDKSVRE